MARDPLFHHLMQELFPSYYLETLDLGPYNNVDYKPKGPLTKNLMCMFPKVIAVLENLIMETWSIYLHRTRELMISSPEMYVSHIMLISYVEDQIVDNIFDKFLMVLTSVTHLAERINIATERDYSISSSKSDSSVSMVTVKQMVANDSYSGLEDFEHVDIWGNEEVDALAKEGSTEALATSLIACLTLSCILSENILIKRLGSSPLA
ncbi:uncharacterized protein TNIN_488731 [Trichonephila inaurata madagascariensis]|uniref:Uncharacterized protein n=1 Tax=Trichonephila inaurata madagascariensis TaxID=2747483 RepID=A0A8X6WY22_9ARAC|nr:uncharacterized protein TNIN_488731 [Trichonephila inaurata madagascariensis]